MDWSTLAGLAARHMLTGIGGYLAGKGLIGTDPAALEQFIGAGMLIGGIGWSAYQKYGRVLVDEGLAKARGVHPNAIAALIAATVLCALPQPTNAADMVPAPVARKAFAAAPGPVSGFYLGINGAMAKSTGKFTLLDVPGSGEVHPSGAMAGVTVGFGGWIGSNLYLGVEADGDYDFTKANVPCVFAPTSCKMRDGFLLTQRAMLGATLPGMAARAQARGLSSPAQWPVPLDIPSSLVNSTVVPYLTAGIAERRTKACIDTIGCNNEWLVGAVAGGGLKVPLSAAIDMKAEYLYINWNKHFNPAGPIVFPSDFKATSEHVLRASLQFHLTP